MIPKAFLETPIAHRALHDVTDKRPENSLAAIRAAIERDYCIEIDLQLSKDGVPMVFHDYSLDRLTDAVGAVAQRTAAELGDIVLKHGDEGIPTLEAVLQLVDGRVPLLIELKDQDRALGPNVGALEKATCAVLHGYRGDAALMSFNPHMVANCAHFAPDIPRGLVTENFTQKACTLVPKERRDELTGIPDYDRVGACFISHKVTQLADDIVTSLKAKKGALVFCWTVRSADAEETARMVADNVTFEGYLA